MSGMWINLMFSGGIYVVLDYSIVPVIINDSLPKRTMKVVNFVSSRWRMCSNFETYHYKRLSHPTGVNTGVNNDGLSRNP